jgi:hypothetical protein
MIDDTTILHSHKSLCIKGLYVALKGYSENLTMRITQCVYKMGKIVSLYMARGCERVLPGHFGCITQRSPFSLQVVS